MLDLGTFIAAPFAAGLLAEMGAEVIKVEQPGTGDPIRDLGDKVDSRSLFWALEGRGRRSVTCNLRQPRGQDLALRLARRSDLVIENFRPGTLERWNLGYDQLRDGQPRTGPAAHLRLRPDRAATPGAPASGASPRPSAG